MGQRTKGLLEKEKRVRVRKRIRTFHLGQQAILKAAGCWAKDYGIKFDPEEQKEAERLWAKLNDTFTEMVSLLTKYIAEDRSEET